MLVLPELDVIQVRIGNLRTSFSSIIPAAVFAIADPTVMQTIEAECVNIRKLCQDLSQHFNEEIAVGPQQTQHAAVWKLHHVGLRNLGGVRCDASPVRVQFIGFSLKARRIHTKNANPQTFVFRNIVLKSIGRDVWTASLQ